ncbi:MAG: hypothetical protein HOV68_27840, partial [Streptomycetaceae bacterium]|nr:hypothetical protein [Streptomycetaceae bacterium]
MSNDQPTTPSGAPEEPHPFFSRPSGRPEPPPRSLPLPDPSADDAEPGADAGRGTGPDA